MARKRKRPEDSAPAPELSQPQPSLSTAEVPVLCARPSSRVRINTLPPLPGLQAWLPFDPSQSILQLKRSISGVLKATGLDPLSAHPQDLQIQIQGFALLNQSLCSLIDPVQDVIDINFLRSAGSKLNSSTTPQSSKSRPNPTLPLSQFKSKCTITPAESTPAPKPAQSTPPLTLTASTSKLKPHEAQLTTSATSVGYGYSTQTVLNPSNHGSQKVNPPPSSPSPKNKPLPISSLGPVNSQTRAPPSAEPSTLSLILVAPPGKGKAATKARNKRKRLRKLYERRQKEAESLRGSGLVTKDGDMTQNHMPHQGSKHRKGHPPGPLGQHLSPKPNCPPAKEGHVSSGPSLSARSRSESVSQDSSSSSTSDSDSSDCESSAPSSTPIQRTPHPSQLVPETFSRAVPIWQDPNLNMLSLSNKNKRKNLKRTGFLEGQRQPCKIVFGSPACSLEDLSRPVGSPVYIPPSPGRSRTSVSSTEESKTYLSSSDPPPSNLHCPMEAVSAPASTHGAPPSLREANLIPPNVLITSIDLLDPDWQPGQVGERLITDEPPLTVSKKRRKRNQKKKSQRSQTAATDALRSTLTNAPHAGGEKSFGMKESANAILEDVEAAYSDFLKSGGHALGSSQLGPFHEHRNILTKWSSFPQVNKSSVITGDRIGIRVVEISLDTLTPESLVYYGTVVYSNEQNCCLKLELSCLPEAILSKQFQHDEGCWEEDEGESFQKMDVDMKKVMRSQLLESVTSELWGDGLVSDGFQERVWEWKCVEDLRKLDVQVVDPYGTARVSI